MNGGCEPLLSVVVCTRERADDLRRCLAALAKQTLAPLEVVVVDNAPRTDGTRRAAREAGARYVVEPRPGQNRARNAGLASARAARIAFTDDDAVPDLDWAATLFATLEEPEVAAVAGEIQALELETDAQRLFERYLSGPAGRRARPGRRVYASPFPPAAAGQVGAGVNMAFRRAALEAVGPFDEAFDVGTSTRSGGDTEMFGRLLAAGYRLVYEPRARVRHRHRRTRQELRSQLFGYGVGVYAFWTHRALVHGDRDALRFALGTLWSHGVRRLGRALVGGSEELPPDLVLAELAGSLYGPLAYLRARRRAPLRRRAVFESREL